MLQAFKIVWSIKLLQISTNDQNKTHPLTTILQTKKNIQSSLPLSLWGKQKQHAQRQTAKKHTCTSCFEQELVARGTWPSSPEIFQLLVGWKSKLQLWEGECNKRNKGSNLYNMFSFWQKKMVSFYYWVEPLYHVQKNQFHFEIWGESLQNGKFQNVDEPIKTLASGMVVIGSSNRYHL